MYEVIFDFFSNKQILNSLKNKKVLFYGAGEFAEELFKYLNFSDFCCVGIADRKFFDNKPDFFHGVKTFFPSEIADLNFDILFISVLYAKKLNSVLSKESYYISSIKNKKKVIYLSNFPYIMQQKLGAKSSDNCIFCLNKGLKSYHSKIAPFISFMMFENKYEKTDLLTCPRCGVSYFKLRPNDEEVCNYYKNRMSKDFLELRAKYEPNINDIYKLHPSYETRLNEVKKCLSPIKHKFINFDNILDFGGDCRFFCDLFPNSNKYSFDKTLNSYNSSYCINCIDSLSDYDNYFSFILSTQVFEHLSDPKAVLIDLYRSIKNGGYIYVTVPDESGLQNDTSLFNCFMNKTNFVMHEHINFYNKKSLKNLFCSVGFKIIDCHAVRVKNYFYKGYLYILACKETL